MQIRIPMFKLYRIKQRTYHYWDFDDPDWRMHTFPIKLKSYAVQMQLLPFIWVTIREYSDSEEWFAKAQAEELLHYLTKD